MLPVHSRHPLYDGSEGLVVDEFLEQTHSLGPMMVDIGRV
jgi:hypothetical protein